MKKLQNMRMWVGLGLLVVLALVLSACTAVAPAAAPPAGEAAATTAPAAEAAAPAGAKPLVALVYGVKGDGFYITMEKGLRERPRKWVSM